MEKKINRKFRQIFISNKAKDISDYQPCRDWRSAGFILKQLSDVLVVRWCSIGIIRDGDVDHSSYGLVHSGVLERVGV